MYYISEFLVKSTLKTLKCANCGFELLFDVDDPNGFKAVSYPIHAKFISFKQNESLLLPSIAVLKIVKATINLQEKSLARKWNGKGEKF